MDTVGAPELPTVSALIAFPEGAMASIMVTDPTNPTITGNIMVYPAQPASRNSAVENDTQPPFQLNTSIYGSSTAYPTSLYQPCIMGQIRHVRVCQLTLHPIQWVPSAHNLIRHNQLNVQITFTGGNNYFKPTPNQGARENSFTKLYNQTILNSEAVSRYTGPVRGFTLSNGAEFLIITDPDFRGAADDLAAWKNSKGISTLVVNTTTTGTTAAQIQDYILAAYQDWEIPPSYILLLGDAEFIPTNYGSANAYDGWKNGVQYNVIANAGDLYYVTVAGGDNLPDLHIGRIPVDTLTQAQTVVDKIINYEQSPPATAAFYDNMVFASYFQDNNRNGVVEASDSDGMDSRAFVQTSEAIRSWFTGTYTVQRIYYTEPAINPTLYSDGTALPAALLKPGFAWDGNDVDIKNAINSGAFLVYHRDHGWWQSWGDPAFDTTDVNALTNGALLPVVFSINCASGIFDTETDAAAYNSSSTLVSFGETFLRKANGGAVAVIGDTRSSSTNVNNDMAEGLFLGVILGKILGQVRLGNVLTFAKVWLTLAGWDGSNLLQELEIYNLLGDPTLEMWTSQPPPATPTFPSVPLAIILTGIAPAALTLERKKRARASSHRDYRSPSRSSPS